MNCELPTVNRERDVGHHRKTVYRVYRDHKDNIDAPAQFHSHHIMGADGETPDFEGETEAQYDPVPHALPGMRAMERDWLHWPAMSTSKPIRVPLEGELLQIVAELN